MPSTEEHTAPDQAFLELPPPGAGARVTHGVGYPPRRNTVADTWDWLWKDTLGRVVPFYLAAGVYACVAGEGVGALGLRHAGWRREVLLGCACGVPIAGIAAAFRAAVAPGYRLPTLADQVLQSMFYLTINAPAEELFWRATIQDVLVRGLTRLPGGTRVARPAGWALATAAFGTYHRLGGWSWRAIAGVTVAGGLFGALYALRRPPTILLPTVIHGFATAGFLSWGDVALHWRARHARRA